MYATKENREPQTTNGREKKKKRKEKVRNARDESKCAGHSSGTAKKKEGPSRDPSHAGPHAKRIRHSSGAPPYVVECDENATGKASEISEGRGGVRRVEANERCGGPPGSRGISRSQRELDKARECAEEAREEEEEERTTATVGARPVRRKEAGHPILRARHHAEFFSGPGPVFLSRWSGKKKKKRGSEGATEEAERSPCRSRGRSGRLRVSRVFFAFLLKLPLSGRRKHASLSRRRVVAGACSLL